MVQQLAHCLKTVNGGASIESKPELKTPSVPSLPCVRAKEASHIGLQPRKSLIFVTYFS